MMCPNPSTDRQSNGVEILQLEARKITEKEERFFIYFRFLHTGELEQCNRNGLSVIKGAC